MRGIDSLHEAPELTFVPSPEAGSSQLSKKSLTTWLGLLTWNFSSKSGFLLLGTLVILHTFMFHIRFTETMVERTGIVVWGMWEDKGKSRYRNTRDTDLASTCA